MAKKKARAFYPIGVPPEYDAGEPTTMIDPTPLIMDRYQSMPRTGSPRSGGKELPRVYGTNSWTLPWESEKKDY